MFSVNFLLKCFRLWYCYVSNLLMNYLEFLQGVYSCFICKKQLTTVIKLILLQEFIGTLYLVLLYLVALINMFLIAVVITPVIYQASEWVTT